MKLDTAFSEVPDDEDLLYSIEHWDGDKIAGRETRHTDREVEAFVHPETATAARILQSDNGTYSVQPSMGDYDNGDCVLQSDDPTEMVSGGSSVAMMGLESLSEARAVAYSWIRGWVMCAGGFHGNVGSVKPAETTTYGEAID